MLTKNPNRTLQEFVRQREEVIKFIRTELLEQGATQMEASLNVARINMWGSRDVQNLYKCITSDLPENTIKKIVAHDFNGLRKPDPYFVPQSRQFDV